MTLGMLCRDFLARLYENSAETRKRGGCTRDREKIPRSLGWDQKKINRSEGYAEVAVGQDGEVAFHKVCGEARNISVLMEEVTDRRPDVDSQPDKTRWEKQIDETLQTANRQGEDQEKRERQPPSTQQTKARQPAAGARKTNP
jgi:hypothetical protein